MSSLMTNENQKNSNSSWTNPIKMAVMTTTSTDQQTTKSSSSNTTSSSSRRHNRNKKTKTREKHKHAIENKQLRDSKVLNLEAEIFLLKEKTKIDIVEAMATQQALELEIQTLKAENSRLLETLGQERLSRDHCSGKMSTLMERAFQDRLWLDQQTARRRAESEALQSGTKVKIEKARRRQTSGW